MFPTAEGAIFELKTLVSILIAVVLGFSIGFERKLRGKEAGVRTHTVVCFGSALMMVVSKYGFGDVKSFDASRIAAQIVSGIGFLGVGVILFRKHEVHGLTTAAGLWATAGIGMAAGAGLYIVAAASALILIVVQCILHCKWGFFHSKRVYRLNIVFRQTENEENIVKEVFGVPHFYSFHVKEDEKGSICEASIFTQKAFSSEQLLLIRKEHPFITSIERIDTF